MHDLTPRDHAGRIAAQWLDKRAALKLAPTVIHIGGETYTTRRETPREVGSRMLRAGRTAYVDGRHVWVS